MSERSTLLRASRRLDWRFLLPDPSLGHVLLAGRPDAELAEALRLFAASVTVLEQDIDEVGPEAFDHAVLCDPTREALEAAAALLAPNGFFYVEARGLLSRRRGRRPTRRAGAYAAALRRLGFASVEAYWHVPSFRASSAIVPLAHGPAVRHLLGRPRGRASGRLQARLAHFLVGTPLLGLAASHVSLVAGRVGEAAPLAGRTTGMEEGGAPAPFVLLTPRFRASRHVVSLLLPPGSDEPVLVAKRPRLPGDIEGIAREATMLAAAEAIGEKAVGTIPTSVAFRPEGRHPVLVETALAGEPITPAVLRREPDRIVALVLDWLTQLPRAEAELDPGWFERLLELPLRRLAACFPAGAEEHALVERTLELCEALRTASFPLVLEHGDLCHPNLLRLADGRVGVLDWELGEERGLPLHDLCFFLAYAASAPRRRGEAQLVRGFHEAFFEPQGFGARAVAAYVERLRIANDLTAPLFVACWARYTSRLVSRIEGERDLDGEDGTTEAAAEDTLAWLRGNRYYALWTHSVESAGAFRLGDPVAVGGPGARRT